MNRRPADLIKEFPKARILVIGDILLDRTIIGNVSRIAPEAPVPVVHVQEEQHFLGGAGNVAANISSLGGTAILAGYVGDDPAAEAVKRMCQHQGIKPAFVATKEPTIQKVRVTSAGQQLVRVDYEENRSYPDSADILSRIAPYFAGPDAVHAIILSDYNKGCLTPAVVSAALASGKPVVVDPKPEHLSMFAGATILQPNHLAVEKAVGRKMDSEEAVSSVGAELAARLGSNLLITRGAHGMSLIEQNGKAMHVPTQAREVYDVTGAGDSSIATLGLALAAGGSLREAVILANQTAGIKVGKRGTATVTARELSFELEAGRTKIKTLEEMKWITDAMRAKGKKLVFTNGFFDILHIGHAKLFKHAKSRGDALALGINTDESIRRLKGEGRPLIPQNERAEILSAIEAVDYIILFDDDTPRDLIQQLKPDIIIKGGNFKTEDVVGYDIVTAYGGKVEIVPLEESRHHLKVSKGIED